MKTAKFKDSPLGPIPQDWEVKRLRDLCEKIGSGATPLGGASSYCQTGIALIRSQNVVDTRFSFDGLAYINSDQADELANVEVLSKDVLLNITGDSVARVCTVPDSALPARVNQHVCILRTIAKKCHYLYLAYRLVVEKKRLLAAAFGGGTRNALTKADVEAFTIPCPPLPEQQRIAEALGEVDKLIESLDAQIEKKRLIAKGVAHDLLGMRDGKNEPIRRLPGFKGGWERKRLDDIGTILKGSGICRAESNTGNIPAIRYGEIYTHHNNIVKQYASFISEKVAQGATRLKVGDIVFAGSGETVEEIGKSVAILDDGVYAGGDTIVFSPKMEVAPIFWGYLLNEPYVQKQKSLKGQGATIVHIRPSDIAAIEVCFPELAEQQAIADLLSEQDAAIAALEEKREKYMRIKDGMMRDLLTGKVRMKGELTKKEACA